MVWLRNILYITAGIGIILLLLLSIEAKVDFFYYVAFYWIICVTVLLWMGNRQLVLLLNRFLPWEKYVSTRFFIQLFVSSVYSLASVNGTYYLFKTYFLGLAPDTEQMFVLNLYGLLFIIPVISINFGIYFMLQWKKSFVYSQQLKQENIQSQLDSLRNHLDPHFLFNNLNILSLLIDKDKQAAQEFLEHFSDVYRYVLKNKNVESIELRTELEFIESYRYLLEKRFKEQLFIHIAVPKHLLTRHIPPLSLQMLVENAVKHNKVSQTAPLTIDIFAEGDTVVVQNNLQVKTIDSFTARSGLVNIKKRYEYLSDKALEIIPGDTYFTVKLPLLNLEKA